MYAKAVEFVRGQQVAQGDEIEEFWALKTSALRSSAARSSASLAATAPARARCSKSSPDHRTDARAGSLYKAGSPACSKSARAFIRN